MNSTGHDVPTSQGHDVDSPGGTPAGGGPGRVAALLLPDLRGQEHTVTVAGFVPGTQEDVTPSRCSRAAALASLLLGAALLALLPAASAAAFYVAVLAVTSAAVALVAGSVLWSRASLVARAAAALAATGTLGTQLLQISLGLPGAAELRDLTLVDTGTTLVLPAAVLGFLLSDARRRHPEPTPDHPYAL